MPILLNDLLAAGGALYGPAVAEQFADWCYDSRLAAPGECFIALRTARADGHDYIAAAIAAGAAGVICAFPPADPGGATVVLADDPQALLLRWASARLAAVGPTVIAVTGSVGKTTTRRAIAAVLGAHAPTFQSRRSFNALPGLPIALARLEDRHRYAVIELGSARRGEIAGLAAAFPPHLAVITNAGPAHLDSLGGPAQIAAELGDVLAPGVRGAIVNGDDPLIAELVPPAANTRQRGVAGGGRRFDAQLAARHPPPDTGQEDRAPEASPPPPPPAADQQKPSSPARHHLTSVIRYGLAPAADLQAEPIAYRLDGTRLRLHWRGASAEASVPLLGEPALYAALAAVAVGLSLGLPLESCAAALAGVEPIAGRLRPLALPGGATLIDDSYSNAPPSARAALRALAALPARRRIAVLGALDDLPVGGEAPFYEELGKLTGATWYGRSAQRPCGVADTSSAQRPCGVADTSWDDRPPPSLDLLICKGDWGPVVARAAQALAPGMPAVVADTTEAILAALPADLGPGDLLLLKGGAAARLEQVAARLIAVSSAQGGVGAERAPPLHPPTHLVRQEPAWRSVRVGAPDRPTWLRIDLDAIAGNVRRLRAIAGVPLMAVLKGDGYGHGAIRAARAALGAGAAALAVATLGEARALRAAGVGAPLLLLGYTPPWQLAEAVRLGLTCTIFDHDAAEALSAAAGDRPALAHLKVDTGMGRLGLSPEEVGPFLRRVRGLPGLEIAGVYTHFAEADAADLAGAEAQLGRFTGLLRELEGAGLRPPLAHAANSAATLRMPAARLDMVRPGIACYGLAPGAAAPLPDGFRPALSFHSEVAQVKAHPAGAPLSYGGAFVTARPSRIATIPVGYADGVRRAPPWRALLVHGRRAPIVGRICMDYLLADVTDIPAVRRGDAVVLIGAQGQARIGADEVAEWLGTIAYEVITGLMPRVPREVHE